MTTEAIILAGGLGTRLRSKVSAMPKSMAPINGLPFLEYQLDYLSDFGVGKIYLAVGYLSEVIVDYFGNTYKNIALEYVYEKEPLGTGGAIKQALDQTKTEEILILNGDTMFQVELDVFYNSHKSQKADFSMALKPMKNFERYGVVKLNETNYVIGFEEKQHQESGDINGGVYILNKSVFNTYSFNPKFSFEREFLEKEYNNLKFNGFISKNYFLDIGIPEDYEQAQVDFKQFKKKLKVDKSWTIFLDRDGVINRKIDNGYVTSIAEFEFLDGAKEAIANLTQKVGRIVIVTNQQCVGKGIISEAQLNDIHAYMNTEIEKAGGKIDKVYFAPQLVAENSIYRKPKAGMADLAQKDFPEIDFSKSILIGDSISDIEFGKIKNMTTIFISDTNKANVDFLFGNLKEILNFIK